jgi:2-iminobutanoate/2-iminopropanoate deaminase
MPKDYITSVTGVPPSPSLISNAVVCGDTCYISGQVAVYDDGYRGGSAQEEARRAFELTFLIAEAAGFARNDIVFVDIAFENLNRDISEINALCDELFDLFTARTVYQAAALPFGAKVKVQAVAIRG